MSLSCLTCQDLHLQRNLSDREYGGEKAVGKVCCVNVERSWSGNLTPPPPHEKIGGDSILKMRKEKHRRLNSTGTVSFNGCSREPRLVRSSGMRRDWSFEDLRRVMH